jgi:hypothetical protein
VSEYQYYEFRAIDRPLDAKALSYLRTLSSRAEITPTSLSVEYNYGNFRGDPEKLVERYFDAFVYVANWGTRQLILRLPRRILELKSVKPFTNGDSLSAKAKGDHVILTFRSEDESGEWEEGEGWMSALAPVRHEVASGDLRALYLGWLLGEQSQDFDDDDVEEGDEAGDRSSEPPIPDGLARLSTPLMKLAEFLRIDRKRIAAAARRAHRATGGRGLGAMKSSDARLTEWIKSLPAAKKDALLIRMVKGADPYLGAELRREFKAGSGRKATTQARGKRKRPAG